MDARYHARDELGLHVHGVYNTYTDRYCNFHLSHLQLIGLTPLSNSHECGRAGLVDRIGVVFWYVSILISQIFDMFDYLNQ